MVSKLLFSSLLILTSFSTYSQIGYFEVDQVLPNLPLYNQDLHKIDSIEQEAIRELNKLLQPLQQLISLPKSSPDSAQIAEKLYRLNRILLELTLTQKAYSRAIEATQDSIDDKWRGYLENNLLNFAQTKGLILFSEKEAFLYSEGYTDLSDEFTAYLNKLEFQQFARY